MRAIIFVFLFFCLIPVSALAFVGVGNSPVISAVQFKNRQTEGTNHVLFGGDNITYGSDSITFGS